MGCEETITAIVEQREQKPRNVTKKRIRAQSQSILSPSPSLSTAFFSLCEGSNGYCSSSFRGFFSFPFLLSATEPKWRFQHEKDVNHKGSNDCPIHILFTFPLHIHLSCDERGSSNLFKNFIPRRAVP